MAALVQTATIVQVDASAATSFNLSMTGTAGGNALTTLWAIFDNNATWTISGVDDSGNSWTTREGTGTRATRVKGVVSWAVGITGGDRTITISLAGTSGGALRYLNYGGLEWSGIKTSAAEDDWDDNSEVDMAATDASAGPIDTTDAGDLIVGVAVVTNNDTTVNWGSPASWTNVYRQNDNSNHQGIDAGYWLPGSIQTSYTAQWSHDNASSHDCAGVVVALLPATGRTTKNTRGFTHGIEVGMNWRGTV